MRGIRFGNRCAHTAAVMAVAVGLLFTAASQGWAAGTAGSQPGCTTGARGPLTPTPPPSDPFYTPPSPLPTVPAGTVIRSEPVCIADLEIPMPYAAWLVMYMSSGSEDSSGQPSNYNATPMAATALIVEPLTDSVKPRPLVAYQAAEDADSTLKAPSYTLRLGTASDNAAWQPMLAQGWDVVVPDYEGPDSADGAGALTAHAVLDSIRAAENFSATDGLEGAQTQVGMWGYSGGAYASGIASELAPAYAPELQIAAVAEGGLPADPKTVFDNLNNGTLAPGLAFVVAVGTNAGYPNLVPTSLFNAAGQALMANFRATGNSSYPAGQPQNIQGYTVCGCNPVDEPGQFPGIAQVVQADALGQHTPTAPLYIYQGFNDELIPFGQVENLVRTYCDGGATVDFHVYPGQEHLSTAVSGAPDAVAYLSARLTGAAPISTCGLPGNGIGVPPSQVPAEPLPPN